MIGLCSAPKNASAFAEFLYGTNACARRAENIGFENCPRRASQITC